MSRLNATFQDWQRATGWGPLPVAESISGPTDTSGERVEHTAGIGIIYSRDSGVGQEAGEALQIDGSAGHHGDQHPLKNALDGFEPNGIIGLGRHDASFVVLTESHAGLGLPNEVKRPDGVQQKASLPTQFQHITEE